MKNQIRQQATELARQLNMPSSELLDLVTLAGLAAIRETLAHRGKLTLPLELATAGDIVPPLHARTVTPLSPGRGMGKAATISPVAEQTVPA